MNTRLIGIDCATTDAKIGIAHGELIGTHVIVNEACHCIKEESAADVVVRWIQQAPQLKTLLAFDAPLGWPKELSNTLIDHRAGQELSIEPNLLFRRETDRFIHAELGKTPLEIGADKIARTAHSALRLLGHLRRNLSAEIPLAWSQDWSGTAAIEVYPAATLLAYGMPAKNYKKPQQLVERKRIITNLRSHLTLPEYDQTISESADALDAVVCLLAASDFVRGLVQAPTDGSLAAQEGWIWFHTSPRSR
jgi:predicted RNase H-like nuclease